MSVSEFPLPDVGEGLTEAEIVSWRVRPGETITVNQVLCEIETAKSLVELPSPFAGTVDALLVAEGQTVEVGTPIVRVRDGADAPADAAPSAGSAARPDGAAPSAAAPAAAVPAAAPSAARAEEVSAAATDTAESIDHDERPGAVLVGYGAKGHVASRRRRAGSGGDAGGRHEGDAATSAVASRPAPSPFVPAASAGPVIAKPPIRKLAKDLGVDLATVQPTGLAGEITRDDVIRQASQASVFRNIQTPEWPEVREERIPVKGVRKAIAQGMVRSAFTAPHVSIFVDVDATRTMEFVKRLKASPDFAGIKVSPMLIMAKAMIWAVRRNPTVNSTWTDEEIIVHHFVNFGFAAATPRGLVVPNVKNAQAMSLRELAQAIEQLTITARDGRLQPADMADGTITVTNIGVFGMDTGTPILNPGEVAIVALGTIKQKPWVVDGEVRPRFVTTLGASFDHRVVDGDVASRFLADVASVIEEPALLLD
ncbi:dihydrolipoamide acetyltransferase family protein [Yonghaparkia sp. Root332]|uniref:dihydrolipoamide acetyltransferase family protein n=1 Tax=Yonghaparkia sp. Root332 TaxID=1736516 RepID=UPI0006FE52E1|nr:dihydrolipoamide acetyltransferase family protein [Yonghaparkia sp. Root332]KQV25887.1 branched-chain alpha-keto acid dehydrogenase subunit E2 [Yonghaparkia sp. Root332]